MSKNKEILIVPLAKVVADEQQPRKNFDASRMADLISSIKTHGIRNPLIVETYGDKYLLEDGERRYRAAKEMGLKEVPVIVEDAKSDTDRLIVQFHLQEQHEGWSATEKASAVAKLAESMHVSAKEIGTMLSINSRTIQQYISFAALLERKEFERSEIPLQYADKILSTRNYVRYLFEKGDMEFTKDNERDLELALIYRVKSGDIRKSTDINKVRDAAKSDPKSILKFIKNDKMSTQALFIAADAKVMFHYRNLIYSANAVSMHAKLGEPLGLEKYLEGNKADIIALRGAYNTIVQLIGKE